VPRAGLVRAIRVTTAIDLEQTPSQRDHGLRNAWVAAAFAVVVGALYGAQAWLFDRHTPYLSRDLIVFALTAFVLTPLVVAVYLSLYELTAELLRKLRDDHLIDPTAILAIDRDGGPMDVNAVAGNLQRALNRAAVRMPMAALAIAYFAYTVGDTWATERSNLTSPATALLIVATLAAQASLVYLATVSVLRMQPEFGDQP
jgi:hypothetical protein